MSGRVILFSHPGGEHVPRPGLENYPWNTRDGHLRKFLLVTAKLARVRSDLTRYDLDQQHRNVALWGEWEPCSLAGKFPTSGDKTLPKAWHRPGLGCTPPEKGKDTDPWIFGSPMRYSNCRQARNPVLRNLDAGDVIFFGSHKKGRTERRFNFYLDTVFVVAARHEYQKAPRVTRERLYIDAIEDVYSRSNKVFLDSEGSGNLLYLPIDKMINQGTRPLPSSDGTRASDSPTPGQARADASNEVVD